MDPFRVNFTLYIYRTPFPWTYSDNREKFVTYLLQVVVNNNTTPADEQTTILKTFLDEFRGLFTQLIQQNGMILNMLTALINDHR